MSGHAYKLVELFGSSPFGTDDAIRRAFEKAVRTLRRIDGFDVIETCGHVADGKAARFRVTLKVGFRRED